MEQEKNEFLANYKTANAEEAEKRKLDISQLQEKLLNASRVEAKKLR